MAVWVDLDGPAQGEAWDVRSVVVGGRTPTDVPAGRADVYVAMSPVYATLADWRTGFAALPAIEFYQRGRIAIEYPEHLLVYLDPGTAGLYTITAQVDAGQLGVVEQVWLL